MTTTTISEVRAGQIVAARDKWLAEGATYWAKASALLSRTGGLIEWTAADWARERRITEVVFTSKARRIEGLFPGVFA